MVILVLFSSYTTDGSFLKGQRAGQGPGLCRDIDSSPHNEQGTAEKTV